MSRCLKDISDEEWLEIWKKLRTFIRKKYWYLEKRLGLDLDDIVQQAILDTLDGRRTWPPADKEVEIVPFLCEVIRSIVSNNFAKAENNVLTWPSDHSSILEDRNRDDHQPQLPDEQAITKEFIEKVHETVGDEFLMKVFEKLILGSKPKEIAEDLEVNIVDVRNAQKRLRRQIRKLRESLEAPMPEGAVSAM